MEGEVREDEEKGTEEEENEEGEPEKGKEPRSERKRRRRFVEEELDMARWKQLIPILYDWFANHHLVWPSLSVRWGPVLEEKRHKYTQLLYFCEQTDGSVPNTLVVAHADVVKPRVAAANDIYQFDYKRRSPFVKKVSCIVHPGEVNRIRELAQDGNIVVTHTDSPKVLMWNTALPHESVMGKPATPDLVLEGHTSNVAEFALATSRAAPLVLSGGQDGSVRMWGVGDHVSATASSAGGPQGAGRGSRLGPRGVFLGHTAKVEDVQFHPTSEAQFCSVGDDGQLLFWDTRAAGSAEGAGAPAMRVERAHERDVHCVDWSPVEPALVVTGSADRTARVFDIRRLQGGGGGVPAGTPPAVHGAGEEGAGAGGGGRGHARPLRILRWGHRAPITCVQWCPDRAEAFASCGEDGCVNIWDCSKGTHKVDKAQGLVPGLLFRHLGHRGSVGEFQWSPVEPWTFCSVASDSSSSKKESDAVGSTLQLWRVMDLIYRPEHSALLELHKFLSSSSVPQTVAAKA